MLSAAPAPASLLGVNALSIPSISVYVITPISAKPYTSRSKDLKNLGLVSLLTIFALAGVAFATACADAAGPESEITIQKHVKTKKIIAAQSNTQDDLKLEVRNISGFTGVHIGGTISADITAGKEFKVTIEAREDILPKIITEVKKGNLIVRFEKGFWKNMRKNKRKHGKVLVTVSLPRLDDVNISGASSAKVSGVDTRAMEIDVSGASSLSIEGNARDINVDLSGASNMKAINLKSESAKMDLSGASSAKLSVSTKLVVDASGASSICYSGSPTVQKDTSGASSVRGGC